MKQTLANDEVTYQKNLIEFKKQRLIEDQMNYEDLAV